MLTYKKLFKKMKFTLKKIEKPECFREDCAALYSKNYKEIFRKKFKDSKNLPSERGILKIKGNNGNIIYRQYWGG